MRAVRVMGAMAATVTAVVASVCAVPPAQASNFGVELNGTYRVKSDGEWARKNEVKFKQQSVLETWTISTSCVSPIECTGEVKSDLGWTAKMWLDDYWFVEHIVPNWIPCENGTFADGLQKFIIWGVDPLTEERVTKNYRLWAGRNITKSDSGACGVNKPLVIELPVRMEKIA